MDQFRRTLAGSVIAAGICLIVAGNQAQATDGRDRPWAPVGNDAYQPIIELISFVDALKKKSN